MARRRYFRRFRGRTRRYATQAYRWARPRFRRFGGRARRAFNVKSIRPNVSMPFIAGTAAGLTTYSALVPGEIKLVLACMPLRGDGAGVIKAAAQGMIIGDLIKAKTGFVIPIPNILGASTTDTTFGSQ